jgi:UDP-glucose 4-epimerase
MRVVVVGATGNVGSALVEALDRDDAVESILGIARRLPQLRLPKVAWRAADVRTDDLVPHMEGADAVVCLSWLIQPSRDEDTLRSVNVDGSRRVFEAAAQAGVPALVYASSVGAYSAGPKDLAVDEGHPTDGIQTSFYSRHKAEVERILDEFEPRNPDMRVVRIRPGLIFGRLAASGIRRLFLGPLFPGSVLRRGFIPVVPRHDRLVFQAVHREDVAEAYRLAIHSDDARGAFNVAAEPVIDSKVLASVLGARRVGVPASLLRTGASLTWRLRLQPTPAGWVDLGLGVPIMDTRRARTELGWEPRHTAIDALTDLLEGLREGAGYPTPPLAPGTGGPFRLHELRTGVGARAS